MRDYSQSDSTALSSMTTLFAAAFGVFGVLHFLVNAFHYQAKLYPSTYGVLLIGTLVLFRPQARCLLAGLLLVLGIDAWLQMPSQSNHTIMKNALLLGFAAAGTITAVRPKTWNAVMQQVIPLGRVILALMYFFGVFHKINRDFLDPQVSCAVALWRAMPLGLPAIDFAWFHHIAIWGTLVIETIILVCLLRPSWRRIGITLGILFHSLLALSDYAMYIQFSMLAVCLHLLYLSPEAAKLILEGERWRKLELVLSSNRGRLGLVIWLGLIGLLCWNWSFSSAGLLWLPVVVVLLWLLATPGVKSAPRHGVGLWSTNWSVNAISVLFLLNCTAPYLGLKTAQSINMFANLRLEGGASNHLLLPNAPEPFSYLDDVVLIEDPGASSKLRYLQSFGLGLVYYDLLNEFDRHPDISVSFWRNGALLKSQTAQTLHDDMDRVLHPAWFRKWFHFNPVDLTSPKPCALDR